MKNITPSYERKDIQKGRCFLVHMAEVCPMIMPCLKGIHLTLESWQPDWDVERWKYTRKEWLEILGDAAWGDNKEANLQDTPSKVEAVPRLLTDLLALKTLSESVTPLLRLIRGVTINHALYEFVDASGEGFGATFLNQVAT
eukprot:9124478-Ditylum_brightwellii.AAC.1